MQVEIYDYIICGAGCAGLSLAYHLSKENLGNKKVLILDRDKKNRNDRTWCFWQKGHSEHDDILDKSWDRIDFNHPELIKQFDIKPYAYKKIKGIDFYNKIVPIIKAHPNFEWKEEEITSISEFKNKAEVVCKSKTYFGSLAFSSFTSNNEIKSSKHHHVLQHFKGWFLESKIDSFDPDVATYMDFRTDQADDLRFFYVLPTTRRKALIELAVFSNNVFTSEKYDTIIASYVKTHLGIVDYQIIEEESGVIPMTTYPFEKANKTHIKYIGTAGGWVKASSGFAFQRIQTFAKSLSNTLLSDGNIDNELKRVHNRFRFYDKIFLNVLLSGKARGDKVFLDLFKNLPPQLIFKFLDEETSLLEEMKLFTAPPFLPFVRALKEELF